MSLETVGKLVAQHSDKPPEMQLTLTKAELEQAALRKMVTWLKWGMILIGLGVALLVVAKTFGTAKWLSLLSMFFMLSGFAVTGIGLFDAMAEGAKLSLAKPGKEVGRGKEVQSLPSVTERTTQLIGVEDAKTNKMMDTKARQ